jgi:alpha-pyrone synthase
VAEAYLNAVGTAVPPFEVHRKFLAWAPRLLPSPRERRLFERMTERAEIEHRYSVLAPHPDPAQLDQDGLYRVGAFAGTAARMAVYEQQAPRLAFAAALDLEADLRGVTHLVLASCTGFSAPGLDLDLIDRLALDPGIERTMVGFMGCYAAINALKLARHIVRSEPGARVLVVCLELCTLHLQESAALEQVLSFSIFADGAAAALVTAEPRGLALCGFAAALVPEARDQITWRVGDGGFAMGLSGEVPATIARELPSRLPAILAGGAAAEVALWAVHPGGRTVLDAVERALDLAPAAMAASREVLRRYGNMSSPSVLFVLKALLRAGGRGRGCALAFGPGLMVESMLFEA